MSIAFKYAALAAGKIIVSSVAATAAIHYAKKIIKNMGV